MQQKNTKTKHTPKPVVICSNC